MRGRDEGGRNARRSGPLVIPNPLCAGNWLGPMAQTGPVHPDNFPRVGALSSPHAAEVRLHWPQSPSPPSASAHYVAPSPPDATAWWQTPSSSPGKHSLPQSRLPVHYLVRTPNPALSWPLHYLETPDSLLLARGCLCTISTSPLSPTWHCLLAIPSGPVLSAKT